MLSQSRKEKGGMKCPKKFSAHRRSPGLSGAQTAECLSRISVLKERKEKIVVVTKRGVERKTIASKHRRIHQKKPYHNQRHWAGLADRFSERLV
jgi:hypothetical protein